MDDYTEQRIVQSRGPAVEFQGRLVASDSFRVNKGEPSTTFMEIWETSGGALIAHTRFEPIEADSEWRPIAMVTVVEPGGDELQRRFRIMESFDWEDRARSMVRKQLKWSLKMRVA